MSEVIPKMPRCNLHSHYYPLGGFCHYCKVELMDLLECPTPNPAVKFTVPLKLCSMKNSKIQARGKVFKNPEVKAFERDFAMLVPSEYRNLQLGSFESPLWAIVTVYYASRRADLSTDLLYDCLQTSGVIANDRFIRRKHEDALIDRDNPRIEIELRVLEL